MIKDTSLLKFVALILIAVSLYHTYGVVRYFLIGKVTQGVVASIERERVGKRINYDIVSTYKVDGKSYEAKGHDFRVRGYEIGDVVDVIYLPNQPEKGVDTVLAQCL